MHSKPVVSWCQLVKEKEIFTLKLAFSLLYYTYVHIAGLSSLLHSMLIEVFIAQFHYVIVQCFSCIFSSTELLALFIEQEKLKQHYKNRLVGYVLNGYLSLRKLVVQRTKLIDDTQEKLLQMLEELTTGRTAQDIYLYI